MTIQTINIGTNPNDNTGDDPRTTGQKLNANFTTSIHAASRDVGTGSGNIPDADDLNMVGATENYTSNNLNTNVFGGVGAAKAMPVGYAQTATALNMLLPINMIAVPASITVTGTFTIQNFQFSTIASGVSALTLSTTSSNNKIAFISITGLSGLSPNSAYYIRTDSATSKIEVN